MKPEIISIHGIRSDGSSNTDKMLAPLRDQGIKMIEGDYDRVSTLDSFFKLRSGMLGLQHDRAQQVIDLAYKEGRNVLAHSFGCLANQRMMEMGCHFNHVFWFAPAMNVDFVLPAWGCKSLTVIHCPDDIALKTGAILRNHDFGRMGIDGHAHEGLDSRITNILVKKKEYLDSNHHSYAFNTQADREHWAKIIADKIKS